MGIDWPYYNQVMNTLWMKLRTTRGGCIFALGIGLALEICILTGLLGYWAYRLGFFGNQIANEPGGTNYSARATVDIPSTVTALANVNPEQTQGFVEKTLVLDITITHDDLGTIVPTAQDLTPTATITETPSPMPWKKTALGKIVFVCFDGKFDQICLMNAVGTGQRKLTNEESPNFYPSLSPDGNQVVFSSRRDGNYEIFIMDIDGENIQQLTDNIGSLYAPEISPKGNRIVFTVATGGKQAIWVMRIDGTNPHPLTEAKFDDIDPTWSPDGEKIAFASDRTGTTQLYVMSADGSGVRQVTRTELKIGGRSSWSRDGDRLAFYAGPQNGRNLYMVDLNGKNLVQLTDGGDNLAPSFSPDGQWLTFTSFRDGNNEVYVIRVDGSEIHRLTDEPNSDWQPRWGR